MSSKMSRKQKFAPLTESEREVCEAANNHFMEGDFETSAEILANIVANRPGDHRFRHNLAVAEFRQRAGFDWGVFVDALNKAFRDANLKQEPENLTEENMEYPVLWYNLAVLRYHQKNFRETLQILDKLSKYKAFNGVPTELTQRTRLLLADVLIRLQQYERALHEIDLYEAQGRAASVDKAEETPKKTSHGTNQPVVNSKFETEAKIKIMQYKIMCHLSMKSLAKGEMEYKRLVLTMGPSHPYAITGSCLKALHDYRGGNFKDALKSIILTQQSISGGDAIEQSLMKNGDLINVALTNNAACCYFYLGKPNIAAVSFQKATQEFDKYTKRDQVKLPLHAIKHSMRPELMYNFGVTLLNLKRPEEAFKYLNICLDHYFCNCRLWLRVAECCIHIHKSDNSDHLSLAKERQCLLTKTVGSEASGIQKLVFQEPSKAYDMHAKKKVSGTKDEEQEPSLEYASICLENALRLVESDSIANEGCLYVRPSTPIFNINEIKYLHSSILCASAYVQLTLGNYPLAIKRCHQLMSMQNMPGAFDYLAKQYLGEAQYKYGNIKEAKEAFCQENICDIRHFYDPDIDDKKDDAEGACSWTGEAVGGYVGRAEGGAVGGYVGGASGGAEGGYVAGAAGGYVGGAAGGYVAGAAGGYVAGAAGGYVAGAAGGYVAGAAGGYVGGAEGGYVAGAAGGYVGGYVAGAAGGYVDGAAGGYVGRYVGGAAGGYVSGAKGGYVGRAKGGYVGGAKGGYVGGAKGGYVGGAKGGYVGGAKGGYVGGAKGGYVGGAKGGYVGGAKGGYAGGPVGVVGGPVGVVGGPVGVVGGPVGVAGGPVGAARGPVGVVGGPVGVAGGPVGAARGPVGVVGGPVGVAGGPVGAARGPVGVAGGPVGVAGGPVGVAGGPVGVARGPVGVAGGPVGVAGAPVGVAGAPVGVAGGPVGVARGPVGVAGGPVGAARGPVGVAGVAVNEAAGGATGGAVGTTKPILEWFPKDESTARAILVYNQAVVMASSGDLQTAGDILRMYISKNGGRDLAPEFLKLAVYLHIRLGNTEKAKTLLRNSVPKN